MARQALLPSRSLPRLGPSSAEAQAPPGDTGRGVSPDSEAILPGGPRPLSHSQPPLALRPHRRRAATAMSLSMARGALTRIRASACIRVRTQRAGLSSYSPGATATVGRRACDSDAVHLEPASPADWPAPTARMSARYSLTSEKPRGSSALLSCRNARGCHWQYMLRHGSPRRAPGP